ncbi:MAG: TonB-dependent receptor [Alistipes sp.]|nr:TonB-dependent receptor [Alistipes sp.]
MKRTIFFAGAATLFATLTSAAQQTDSIEMYEIQKIEVTATRAARETPIAYTDISKQEISDNNYGRDIPFLLQTQPSVVATSEAGTGIGGTSLRIRGTDATRINVTMNGVPMNDAESHSVYWYDTPDIASSVGSMQLQRGAGTSTNGTGAFGGSLNMTTESLSTEFNGSASLSYGSFNTNKQAVHVSSGLMGGHWIVDARLSHIGSDGYVERASSDLKSYMFQAAYYNGRTMVKALSFGGKARVYLSYTGLTKEQMAENRRYNPEGEIIGYLHDAAGNHILDEWGSPKTGVIGFYKDHTDNYLQINNQIIVSHRFDDRWSLNVTGHYTYGDGFYENYKNDQKLAKYGIDPIEIDGTTVKRTNLVRRKNVRNDFGGIVASTNYTSRKVSLSIGLAGNIYDGNHNGRIFSLEKAPAFPETEYYRNYTTKYDANIFARANWNITGGLNLFADMQYRHITHKIHGINDNYDDTTSALQTLDIDRNYDFFNPKAGLSYSFAEHHNAYVSFAVAHKEPTRNNFTDTKGNEYPTAERLFDWEFGYRFEYEKVSAGINFYYMDYKDQLILTGEVSDTGEALARNIPKSFRRGIELTVAWKVAKWFTFSGNATFSQNRIKNYEEHVTLYDNSSDWTWKGEQVNKLGETTIAYSPSIIAGVMFDFHVKGFQALLQTQYVSKQYLTNAENENMTLDRYCVTNLNLAYTLQTKRINKIRFGIQLNNLFNTEYCNNGYGYSSAFETGERLDETFYFPQARFNVLGNVTVMF